MIQKKICMLGSHGVGKTSLVRRYVHSIFSEKYHSTIGVKIDKRETDIDGKQVRLMLWDVAGEEDEYRIPPSYFTGTAGSLLVVDGTRVETVDAALEIQDRVEKILGGIPAVLMVNKADLTDLWEITDDSLKPFRDKNVPVFRSSAKTGENVDEAFTLLARSILGA